MTLSGDPCDEKNVLPVMRATGQVQGDRVSEFERVKNYTAAQDSHYEGQIANLLGIPWDSKKPVSALSVLDQQKNLSKKNALEDSRLYWANPSKEIPTIYKFFDEKFEAFYKKPEGQGDLKTDVTAHATKMLKYLDESVVKAGVGPNWREYLDRSLKQIGIDHTKVYEARSYLEWVSNGAFLQKAKNLNPITNSAKSLAKAQKWNNLLWVMGQGPDMIRPYAYYITKDASGVSKVLQGTIDAIVATKGNPFAKVKELEDAGIYKSGHLGVGDSRWDLFDRSIIAQKNLTYYLDKASGGNGYDGIRDFIFDTKPWDAPRYMRNSASNLIFGLARYSINEARWYLKLHKDAILETGKGNLQPATNLLVYSLAKNFFTGTKSLVPAGVYLAFKDEIDDFNNKLDESAPEFLKGNHIKKWTGVDLSTYVQPLGGTLGARLSSLSDTVAGGFKNLAEGTKYASEGKIDAALLDGASVVMSLANLGLLAHFSSVTPSSKVQEAAHYIENSGLNAVNIRKMLSTSADYVAKEFGFDDYKVKLLKDLFGSQNIKEE